MMAVAKAISVINFLLCSASRFLAKLASWLGAAGSDFRAETKRAQTAGGVHRPSG